MRALTTAWLVTGTKNGTTSHHRAAVISARAMHIRAVRATEKRERGFLPGPAVVWTVRGSAGAAAASAPSVRESSLGPSARASSRRPWETPWVAWPLWEFMQLPPRVNGAQGVAPRLILERMSAFKANERGSTVREEGDRAWSNNGMGGRAADWAASYLRADRTSADPHSTRATNTPPVPDARTRGTPRGETRLFRQTTDQRNITSAVRGRSSSSSRHVFSVRTE